MFEDYEVVKLKDDLPSEGLSAGARGTVLMVYPEPPSEYEVEFLDGDGETLAVLTLPEEKLAKVPSNELMQSEAA